MLLLQFCLAARPWPADDLSPARTAEDNNDSADSFSIHAAENDHEAAKASGHETISSSDAENLLRHVLGENKQTGPLNIEDCP